MVHQLLGRGGGERRRRQGRWRRFCQCRCRGRRPWLSTTARCVRRSSADGGGGGGRRILPYCLSCRGRRNLPTSSYPHSHMMKGGRVLSRPSHTVKGMGPPQVFVTSRPSLIVAGLLVVRACGRLLTGASRLDGIQVKPIPLEGCRRGARKSSF